MIVEVGLHCHAPSGDTEPIESVPEIRRRQESASQLTPGRSARNSTPGCQIFMGPLDETVGTGGFAHASNMEDKVPRGQKRLDWN